MRQTRGIDLLDLGFRHEVLQHSFIPTIKLFQKNPYSGASDRHVPEGTSLPSLHPALVISMKQLRVFECNSLFWLSEPEYKGAGI